MAANIAPLTRAVLLARKPELLEAELADISENTELGIYVDRMLDQYELFGREDTPLHVTDKALGIVVQAARHAALTMQWGECERWLSVYEMIVKADLWGIKDTAVRKGKEGQRVLEDAAAGIQNVYDILEQFIQ